MTWFYDPHVAYSSVLPSMFSSLRFYCAVTMLFYVMFKSVFSISVSDNNTTFQTDEKASVQPLVAWEPVEEKIKVKEEPKEQMITFIVTSEHTTEDTR